MAGVKCSYVYPAPWMGPAGDGKCGRFALRSSPPNNPRCATHDEGHKATLKAKRIAKRSRLVGGSSPVVAFRAEQIATLKELLVWWDGPGSEGREV